MTVAGGGTYAKDFDLDDLQSERGYKKFAMIGKSAALNELLTVEQTRRYEGIRFCNYGPGLVRTKTTMATPFAWLFFQSIGRLFTRSPEQAGADMAELAVQAGIAGDNRVIDAVGPEVFTFRDLVRHIAEAVGSRAKIVSMNPSFVSGLARVFGWFLGDVLLTRQEIEGLMAGLLVSSESPTCSTPFTDWLNTNGDSLGRAYASEVERHYR